MKKLLFILSAMQLMQAAAVSVFAQSELGNWEGSKVGNVISGKVTEMVSDSILPLSNVNVFVIESDSFIVGFHSTDANGVFSFPVSNPDNKILIQVIGYNSLILPLDRKNYDIRLEKGKDEKPYYFEFRIKNGKGKPIPLREASKPVETLDMSQFEDLGIYTIDEALNAKFGLDLPWE